MDKETRFSFFATMGGGPRFLTLAVASVAIIYGGAYAFYHFELRHIQEKMTIEEMHHLQIESTDIASSFKLLAYNILFLADQVRLHDPYKNETNRQVLIQDMLSFLRTNEAFDHIRLLSLDGNEYIRASSQDGQAIIISPSNLQNKQASYYFQRALTLKKNEIYISPVDLNVEYGKIEQPYNPTIRFAMPCYNAAGEKIGILVLNYRADDIMLHIRYDDISYFGSLMLLNQEGYWLSHPDPDQEWGFLFENKKNLTLARQKPMVWQSMQNEDSGIIQDGDDVYVHVTVDPLMQINEIPLIHLNDNQAYHWKMISYLPEEVFLNAAKPTLDRIITFSTVLAVLFLAGSFWLAIILTRKQQAYQLLEQSESRYHQLYDNSPLGYQSLDKVGNLIEVNEALAFMLGYSEKELTSINFADILSEPSKHKFHKNFPRFKKKGEITDVEFELIHKDGSIIPVSIHGRVAYDETGKFKQTHCVISNISERKHAEEISIAQHRLEATETLAGGIAHLINNHMASVVGTAGLIKMKYKDDKDLVDKLNRIETSGMKGSELAKELLAYARGGQYESKIFNLNEVITTMIKPANEVIANINLQYHLAPDLWNIKADSNQMQQIIEALTNNAIESIDHHGNIHIRTENILIDDTISLPCPNFELGTYICLTVKDDGVGIEQDHLKKVFEPFFTTKFQGRGLGLAATYGIVKHANGYITVNSELGKGATFHIYIPNEPDQQNAVQTVKETMQTDQLNILIADDETQVRETLKEILDELGHHIITASNGKEAITVAKKQPNTLDLIILDLAMPVMDGSQALPILKQDHPEAKVIIVSGYEIDAKAQHILTADAFLQKPYEVEKLIDVIDELFKD